MTLNLAQVREQVKSNIVQPNPKSTHIVAINAMYRELKNSGWVSTMQLHHTERTPVFVMDGVSLCRDKSSDYTWLIETDAGTFQANGTVSEITEYAQTLTPAPAHPADDIAADLVTEYPELISRIERAADLVKAGQIEFGKYNTAYDNSGFDGLRTCECPDAYYRNLRASWGVACKHTIAQLIADRIDGDSEAVATREYVEEIQRKQAQLDREAVAKEYNDNNGFLRADPINRKGHFNRNFNRTYHA